MTATYTKYTLQLNSERDADVIEYLAGQANKADAIKRALRAQMETREQLSEAGKMGRQLHSRALARPFHEGVSGHRYVDLSGGILMMETENLRKCIRVAKRGGILTTDDRHEVADFAEAELYALESANAALREALDGGKEEAC